MKMSELNVQVQLISAALIGLLVFSPVLVLGQGCSIAGQTGQLIDIYNVPISSDPSVIGQFLVENSLSIENAYNEDMKEEYIAATLTDEVLLIHKTDKFALYAENESETSINFKVQFKCISGNTEGVSAPYTFTVYLLVTNDNAPIFPQNEYRLVVPLPLPANFELTLYGEIFARDIDLGDNQVQFSGGNSYFAVSTIGRSTANPKSYYMSLKTARQILILPAEAQVFEVTATDNGGLTGRASVQMNADPDNTYTRDASPTFEQRTYSFNVDAEGVFHSVPVSVTETSFVEQEVTISLGGQDQSYFSTTPTAGRQVQILLTGSIDEEVFKERTYLTFDILASRTGYETGHTTVFVDLPVDCSSDPSTTTPAPCQIISCPDADGPVFSSKLYTFRLFEGTLGGLGTPLEVTVSDPQLLPTLKFRLNYKDASWLENFVIIDEKTGMLNIIHNAVPEGTNFFDIEVMATVEDQETTKVGTAIISVVIDKNEECSETTVNKALAFVTVTEEQKNEDIFDIHIGDCNYQILSVIPISEPDLIFIDENNKLSTIVIDRESEMFGHMTVPQVQVKLKLVCPQNDNLLLRKRRAIEDNLDYVYTEEIAFNSDVTQLNIFIEDINDNPPVFEYPTEDVSHIGYPDADLVQLLFHPYLIKVEASDADVGVNALIEYSVGANNYFDIDSKTGVIFPLVQDMEDNVLPLIVTASDGVHRTSVEVHVHKLKLDNLIVVYVKDFGYHELEQVHKTLESELGQTVNILKYANVPANYDKKTSTILSRATTGTTLKLIVYAFDEDNRLIGAEDLIAKFNSIDETTAFLVTTSKLADEIPSTPDDKGDCDEGDEGDRDNGTFVAVIITLSVLVLILLCGGFVGWWFWIRPTEWKHIEETQSVENVRVDPTPSNHVNVATKASEETVEKERPSLKLNGNTWTESTDAAPQIIKNITTAEEVNSNITFTHNVIGASAAAAHSTTTPNATPRERKKSITFNENVERIEIETEVPVTVNTYQF